MSGIKSLIKGFGINNADYNVQPFYYKDGIRKQKICPFYHKWTSMISRCYCPLELKKRPTYKGCTVSEDWRYFMNFRGWMVQQDYQQKELDKDFLVKGNKVYSLDTCIFISQSLNKFLNEGAKKIGGSLPVGVIERRTELKCGLRIDYRARCCDPFTNKLKHLGYHATPEQAQQAYIGYKNMLAHRLAELETDPRIILALQTRYK